MKENIKKSWGCSGCGAERKNFQPFELDVVNTNGGKRKNKNQPFFYGERFFYLGKLPFRFFRITIMLFFCKTQFCGKCGQGQCPLQELGTESPKFSRF